MNTQDRAAKSVSQNPMPVHLVSDIKTIKKALSKAQAAWLDAHDFEAKAGQFLAVPDEHGRISLYVYGLGNDPDAAPLQAGGVAPQLPEGTYQVLADHKDETELARHQLAFDLGAYTFSLEANAQAKAKRATDDHQDPEMRALRDGAYLARDLINMPANILGPDAFAAEAKAFAKSHKMSVNEIVGDELLAQNFPMIHAVGRASDQAPRLLDMSWGKKSDPCVTLVGKGVTFDTGGLDIKSAAGMALMKKDMGGAANILGLAQVIMQAKLKVKLRVLLPIVENAISGSAFRPGDVLKSRKGISVEIGNTDAEGRLILADALALGAETNPDLMIDMATLTGAARIALGFDLPALFTSDDDLAIAMERHGRYWGDPVWRMPLWQPYAQTMASRVADVNHIASSPYGGAIVAGLFLEKFAQGAKSWAHLDISGWSLDARPGRTVGGADLGIRASYFALKDRYGR